MRARLFDEMGLLRFLPLHAATPAAVSDAILTGLEMERRTVPAPISLDGAKNAAQKLVSMLPADVRTCRVESYKADGERIHAVF